MAKHDLTRRGSAATPGSLTQTLPTTPHHPAHKRQAIPNKATTIH